MTVRKMQLKIFLLFFLVNFTDNEERNGFWRFQENDNIRRNNFEASENINKGEIKFPNNIYFSNDRSSNGKNKSSNNDLLSQKNCGLNVPRRIIGGTTTDIDEFPWLCLLQYVSPSGVVSYDCSGVLISKTFVLTAAHCTDGLGITSRKLKLRKVRLGEWDISTDKDCQGDVCSSSVQEIDIEKVIPHEKYKAEEKSQFNDIALIRLRKEASLNRRGHNSCLREFIQPICLPFGNMKFKDLEGKKLTVSGWGKTSNARDSSSNIKMKVDLPIISWERCSEFYNSFYGGLNISKNQFCAGGEDGKDSCQGDSGGPLMTTEKTQNEIKWVVIGIVSSGPAACAVEGRPSLYTNVSQFTDWILDNIKS